MLRHSKIYHWHEKLWLHQLRFSVGRYGVTFYWPTKPLKK